VVVLLMAATACLISFFPGGGAKTPTPEIARPTQPPETELSWEKVRAAGVLKVGTSADYPPFEFYTPDFKIDGFDIALIQSLGQAAGVKVEVQDYAFDGLAAALTAGQIDAAVAAISVTPERAALAEFTNIYFVGSDAVLANQNSVVGGLGNVDALAAYRVGVQVNSVYDRFMHRTLVSAGKMPAQNLFVYPGIGPAVKDMRDGKIDMVVMDLAAAQSYVNAGGAKIVGRDFNPQFYAVMLRKQDISLRDQLNSVLVQVTNSGGLAELQKRYLGIQNPVIPPTPTPGPTATANPAPALPPCVDGMAFVSDLNLPDDNMQTPVLLSPGQPFVKGWRIKNTGTCIWGSIYRLVYVSGNSPYASMGGVPVPLQGNVQPNAPYDLSVNLVAPVYPGTYQGFWQMVNPNGVPFGQRIWVGIRVPAQPTATLSPTQTPSQSAGLSVNPAIIRAGQLTVLNWSTVGASAVYLYQPGQNYLNYPVAGQGGRELFPDSTQTYELRAVFPSGAVEVRRTTIQVIPGANMPVIRQFTVSQDPVPAGQCLNLDWDISGPVSQVFLYRDATAIWQNAPLQGSIKECPTVPGSLLYTLDAVGPGGKIREIRQVLVGPAAPSTSTPPPATVPAERLPTAGPPPTAIPPLPPIIDGFSATPARVRAGGCMQLFWQTSGTVALVQLKRNGIVVLDQAPLDGSGQDCLPNPGQYTYRIEAFSRDRQSAFKEVVVTVDALSPTDLALTSGPWQMKFYFDGVGALIGPLPSSRVTFLFGKDGRVTGNASCNDFSATYQINGQSLRISPPGSIAQKTCGEPRVMDQEAKILASLSKIAGYSIQNNQLTLLDTSGVQAIVFDFAGQTPP
jgi:ABC-type amino acid transport substrate-binding protein